MEHIVTIEKIVAGGKGLARLDNGKVVMTDFVLPGESVRVQIRKDFSGYAEGELLEVLSPSPQRMQPKCVHYGECGGCDLQHTDYRSQLIIKKNIVQEAMVRAKVLLPDEGVQDTVPSPEQWGYRCRLRLKVDQNGQPGFFRKKTNDFVAVSNCPVAAEAVNDALIELRNTACLRELVNCNEIELLLSPLDQTITLVLVLTDKKPPSAAIVQTIAACSSLDVIGYKAGKKFSQLVPAQPPALLAQKFILPDRRKSCSLSWTAACFSQVNAEQNEQLVQLVCRLAGDVRHQRVLDLYCGTGNFSLPLAMQGAAVTGIEYNRASISMAKQNADANGVVCSFFAADVHNALRELVQNQQQVDIIILDPPRRGIGNAAVLLHNLKSRQIIYISCDPATLARDLSTIGRHGYKIKKLIPVDMFSQTHHIESVALLEKN